jgi:hypothetical protein
MLAVPGELSGQFEVPDSVIHISLSLVISPGFSPPALLKFGRESRLRSFNYCCENWGMAKGGVFSHFSERTLKAFRNLGEANGEVIAKDRRI